MQVTKQTVSPNQFEIIDDDGKVLGCYDTSELALAAMAKVTADRSTRPIPRAEVSLFPRMPTSVAEVITTAKELKQQQKREG